MLIVTEFGKSVEGMFYASPKSIINSDWWIKHYLLWLLGVRAATALLHGISFSAILFDHIAGLSSMAKKSYFYLNISPSFLSHIQDLLTEMFFFPYWYSSICYICILRFIYFKNNTLHDYSQHSESRQMTM